MNLPNPLQQSANHIMKKWVASELYQAFCAGTAEETRAAYEYLLPRLTAICFKVWAPSALLANSQELAQDCVHHALFNTWRHAAEIKNADAFEGYVQKAVENQAKNMKVQVEKQPRTALDDVAELIEASGQTPEEAVLYQDLLLELTFLLRIAPYSTRSRYIVAATYIEDIQESKTIAQQLSAVEGKAVRVPEIHSTLSHNLRTLRTNDTINVRLRDVLQEIIKLQSR